jgi:hypothetical protein
MKQITKNKIGQGVFGTLTVLTGLPALLWFMLVVFAAGGESYYEKQECYAEGGGSSCSGGGDLKALLAGVAPLIVPGAFAAGLGYNSNKIDAANAAAAVRRRLAKYDARRHAAKIAKIRGKRR